MMAGMPKFGPGIKLPKHNRDAHIWSVEVVGITEDGLIIDTPNDPNITPTFMVSYYMGDRDPNFPIPIIMIISDGYRWWRRSLRSWAEISNGHPAQLIPNVQWAVEPKWKPDVPPYSINEVPGYAELGEAISKLL